MEKNLLGDRFIKNLTDEALNSPAVNHPYLRAFSKGEFPDVEFATKDYAYQYGLYNKQFVRYLSTVIDNLSEAQHKEILQSNLEEEKGHVHDVILPADVLASINDQPHTQLYRRFQKAIGVDFDRPLSSADREAGLHWSEQFLSLCKINACVGVGALGIGTELIVSKIYHQILEGLRNFTDLTLSQRVFFELHTECDEEHAAQLIEIAQDLAINEEACKQIEYGVSKAIHMRVEFWDKMYERALNISSQDTLETLEAI